MLLKGVTTKKKTFISYLQTGPKLCPLPYHKRASDFEDLLDSLDRYEHPNGTNVTVREIYCRKYALGVFESKEPGQVKAKKKTYFLEVQK
jgi:hypothetical protein